MPKTISEFFEFKEYITTIDFLVLYQFDLKMPHCGYSEVYLVNADATIKEYTERIESIPHLIVKSVL